MAGYTLNSRRIISCAVGLLYFLSGSSQSFAGSAAKWQQLGQPVQYVLSTISSVSAAQLVLADGTVWRSSQPGFGLAATPVLIFSTNRLASGSAELRLHGFTFNARFSDGKLNALSGRKIDVLATENKGSMIMLANNVRLFVVEQDRRYSVHWQPPFQAMLTENWQLVHLPTLQRVSVIPITH